jgi:hypothetical protein
LDLKGLGGKRMPRGKDGGQGLGFCARAGVNVALVGKATTLSDVWEAAVVFGLIPVWIGVAAKVREGGEEGIIGPCH